MKKLILSGGRLLCFVSLLCGSSSVGRSEITVSASATANYDSNLSGRRGSDEDYYSTFNPRVSYVRRGGKIEGDAGVSLSVQRYLDHREYNSEDVSADASFRLSPKISPNLTGALTVNYNESYDVDLDVNSRIRSNSTTVGAQASLITGIRTSISANAAFSNSDRVGASDQKTFSGGATFNYRGFLDGTSLGLIYGYTRAESSGQNILGADLDQVSHSFSASLSRAIYHDVTGSVSYGYRWLDRSVAETSAGSPNQNGGFVRATIEGPFLPRQLFPKITSHASLSYEDAQTPGINDLGGKQVTGDIGVTWAARQSTSVTLGATRSQRLSSTDLTVVSSSVNASVSQNLRRNLSGTVGARYNWESYRGIARKDEVLSLNGGLNYSFASSWTASGSYTFTSTSSTQAISDFTRHSAMISVGYTF
jgi:hypothetical protein